MPLKADRNGRQNRGDFILAAFWQPSMIAHNKSAYRKSTYPIHCCIFDIDGFCLRPPLRQNKTFAL